MKIHETRKDHLQPLSFCLTLCYDRKKIGGGITLPKSSRAYKSEKRSKELRRLKKQEEKRLKRLARRKKLPEGPTELIP